MGLQIIWSKAEQQVSQDVRDALAQAMACGGRAALIVPAAAQVLEASKVLAQSAGLSLGVSVHTLSSFTKEQWESFGDGRKLVDATSRSLLVARIAERAEQNGSLDPLSSGAGTVGLISDVARVCLPLPEPFDSLCEGLTSGEVAALRLVRIYSETLHQLGLVEECEAMHLLGRQEACRVPLVLCANGSYLPHQLRFLVQMANKSEVVCVTHASTQGGHAATKEVVESLRQLAGNASCTLSEHEGQPADQPHRAHELQELLGMLYTEQPDASVVSEGGLSLVLPAGPVAEPEAVAQTLVGLAQGGAKSIVVVSNQVARTWSQLAGRLSARGLGVRAHIVQDALALPAGRAFAAFCHAVARLSDLTRLWPNVGPINDELFDARAELAQGPYDPDAPLEVDMAGLSRMADASLGPMDWWPPQELSDFLLSDLSGVPRQQAWNLDARWRGNRILSPTDVLGMLRKSSVTSHACAEATQQLVERKSVGGAARVLARALTEQPDEGEPAAAKLDQAQLNEALSALQAFASLEQTAYALGMRPELGDEDAELLPYVDALLSAASSAPVASRLLLAPENKTCEVSFLTPRQAACLAPASVDAVVYLGLDTQCSAIPRSDTALGTLLNKLGQAGEVEPLVAERERYGACLAAAKQHVALERTEYDDTSAETFPAVMLSETLACYRDPSALPCLRRGEDLVSQNLSELARAAVANKADVLPALGRLRESSRPFVTVPNNGSARAAGSALMLSATQLETYLDCPYKWFVARRIGLDSPDAGFSNLETGSFAHRVMELTHQHLLANAYRKAHPDAVFSYSPAEDPRFDPRERLEGSRVTAETLAEATELLDREFVRHLAHQYRAATRRASQGLIPHLASERFGLSRLRDDLVSSLQREAQLFLGFEPRFFELPFGRAGMQQVTFAGAHFNGTIDRVDVDAEGHALIIDYKHKSMLFDEYSLFDREAVKQAGLDGGSCVYELPRHVQTLVYAQALKQLMPQLETVGVVYLGTRGEHELSGAVSGAFVERVFGEPIPDTQSARVAVPGPVAAQMGIRSFDELLQCSEELLSGVVERMNQGFIEAHPRGDDGDKRYRYVCDWCPVAECERRRS